jgi:hypothetical protein
MKFGYIDESGDSGKGDVFVMAGVLIDAYRLRKATAEFDQKLKDLRQGHPSAPNDFKASKIINGKGGWRDVSPEARKQFFTDIVNQAVSVGRIYAFALSFDRFNQTTQSIDGLPSNQGNYWVACSMCLSALIQKKVQKEKNSKGLSVLIFDDNKQYMPKLSDGLYDCNKWYDDLYALPKTLRGNTVWKVKPSERFDHIINSAFAIKSEHSSLVQVADIISYIYRRFVELCNSDEAYDGEKQLYENWVNVLATKREKIGRVPTGSKTIKFYKDVCHPNWEM